MFILILGLIAAVVLFIMLGLQPEETVVTDARGVTKTKKTGRYSWKRRPAQALALVVLVAALILGSVTVVPTAAPRRCRSSPRPFPATSSRWTCSSA